MKTLDEVIEALARDEYYCSACPLEEYCQGVTVSCYIEDALYYLKHLQDFYEICNTGGVLEPEPRSVEIGSGVEIKWHEPNSALTWDELREMEGKPVWVEVDGKWWGRFWAFVEVINDAYANFYQKGQEYPEDLWKRDIGKTWQAYRKERSDAS